MADDIATLGIDTNIFEQRMESAVQRMTELGTEALVVTGRLAGMAAIAAGALAIGIHQANKRAEELENTLRDIEGLDPLNTAMTSVSEFQSRLKTVRQELEKLDKIDIQTKIFDFVSSANILKPLGGKGGGYERVLNEQETARNRLLKEQDDIHRDITSKTMARVEILNRQLDGDKEGASLLKNQLEYKEKIGAAMREGNGFLAEALAKEEKVTEELIKQEGAKKRAMSLSEDVAEQAKNAVDSLLNDKKNAQIIADREADKEEKRIEQLRDFEADQYQDFLRQKDRDAQDQREHEADQYQEWLRERERQQNAHLERMRENAKRNNELGEMAVEESLSDSGNQTAASRERVRNDYARDIQAEREKGNEPGARLLEREMQERLDELAGQEANKTPAQRRAERAAGRKNNRDKERGRNYNADLDDRIDRGARGDENSSIEQRRRERIQEQQFGPSFEEVIGKPDTQAGYGPTDRKYLRDILNQLTPKS